MRNGWLARSTKSAWAMLLCMSTTMLGCGVQDAPPAPDLPFAIRIVDQRVDASSRQGPSGSDLVPTFKPPGAVWLKREGAIEGALIVDARVGTGSDGSAVVDFTLTPEALDQLAALTRANIGQRLAMVVNGKAVVNTLIAGEAPRSSLEISGDFTDAEAQAIAAEMMESRPPGGK